MNKLLITIATLFAYSIIFAQTWNTGTGAWISPLSKNIGIQKSLQVGDNVGTDSLWCKTDLNYFEGNVGIGTTTPEAKLHVSMSDTTGVEIAHFENNSDNAIMTLHSHADSSAILLLQTGNKSAVFALTGVTGEVVLTNGLAVNAIEIDTTGSVTIPDLAGSAQKLVTALADGTLDTLSASELRGYKVYTALLTQYAPVTGQTSGVLNIGERYTIDTYVAGDNFSNVASVVSGTINTTGCVFIATGTTPTTWTNSSDLSSLGAPIATVLENTIGSVTWTYVSQGLYSITSSALFTVGKTWFEIQEIYGNQGAAQIIYGTSSQIDVFTATTVSNLEAGTLADDILGTNPRPIEIRVYY